MPTATTHVVVGQVGKPYGIKGWVKINSFTQPIENILTYDSWQLCYAEKLQPIERIEARKQGNAIVAHFKGCTTPEEAKNFTGIEIAILRSDLPRLPQDEYYWTDLENLKVVTIEGVELGTVAYLFTSGANDVLVVKGDKERLLPFTMGQVVQKVDLERKYIEVDWDPEF